MDETVEERVHLRGRAGHSAAHPEGEQGEEGPRERLRQRGPVLRLWQPLLDSPSEVTLPELEEFLAAARGEERIVEATHLGDVSENTRSRCMFAWTCTCGRGGASPLAAK